MISVIIPHYQLHDILRVFCLPALYLYSQGVEIIIVDNGSKEPLTIDGDFKVVRSEERLSFASACNLGATEAKGDVFVFLNNDCHILPGWMKIAEMDKQTKIVGAKLFGQDGSLQHIGIEFGKKRVPYHPHIGEKDDKGGGTKEVVAVTGAFMAVDASWFKSVDGFSTEFPDGNYEDVDLCLQARDQGHKVKIDLDVKATHIGGLSYQVHPEEHQELLVRRNWEILKDRWNHKPNSFFGITAKSPLLPREVEWKL